jgi:hypothetical protein
MMGMETIVLRILFHYQFENYIMFGNEGYCKSYSIGNVHTVSCNLVVVVVVVVFSKVVLFFRLL